MRGRDHPESSKSSRPFCAFHNTHSHNTNDCQELRAIRDGHFGRRPSAMTGATTEEDMVVDVGMTVACARSGATGLMRTTGRISLARAPGGTNHARIILRATLVFLPYLHHQEGTTTTIKTRGLGASRSRVLSPASWAELRPQHLSVFSSSLLKGERSTSQARGHAPAQVVQVCHHLQLGGQAQVARPLLAPSRCSAHPSSATYKSPRLSSTAA